MSEQRSPASGPVVLLRPGGDSGGDAAPEALRERLRAAGLEVTAMDAFAPDEAAIRQAPFLVMGPDVPLDAPALRTAREAGVPVLEDLEMAAGPGDAPAGRLADLHARLLAARRLEVVGRLVGGVAHDFNNVLSVVATLSELLLRFGAEDAPEREDLEEIRDAARRGSELTRQLQAFARADVGDVRVVDLGERLRGAEKLLRKLLPEDVAVVIQPGDGVPAAGLDPVEADQILFNLAAYGRWILRGGGSLRLATEAGEDGWPCVVLDLAPRPGAHLSQEPDADGGPAQGLGIPGLAPVEEIVRHRTGRLVVADPGEHARRVEVHLPVAQAEPSGPGSGEGPRVEGAGRRVLVVEDDDPVREAMVRMLQALDFHARGVTDGVGAMELLRESPWHGVVCDTVLHDGWGSELHDRARDEGFDVPFLFVSGHEDHPAVQAIRRGGLPLIRKPVTAAALTRAVGAVLEPGRG